ncbi:hypothetical protein LRY60_02120 [Candidatus Woesebacteria bacterium]|nr:hypothetical protein [Candidatus Woesebacteria bacterium]
MAEITSVTRTLVAQVNLGESYLLRPDGPSVASVYDSPATLINILLPNVYVLAGVLLFIFIFAAGFRMVMNPDNKKAPKKARKPFSTPLAGLYYCWLHSG